MSQDRAVTFWTMPSNGDIESLITRFFGDAATEIRWSKDRFYVTLAGPASFVRRRREGTEERLLEVWITEKDRKMVIITRQADEYTNGNAETLAQLAADTLGGVRAAE